MLHASYLCSKNNRVVDASSSAFCSRGSLALARSQTLESSVQSVLLQLPNASVNVGSGLSCCWAIMKLFVCWMPECFKKPNQPWQDQRYLL